MTIQTLERIPFYGDTLLLTERDGQPYTPLKPIIEAIGLDWPTQRRKVDSNERRWGMVKMTMPSSGGAQAMSCLPVRKLPAFLATVHPNKVRPDLREKIVRYQNECDDALWQHWSKLKTDRANSEPSLISPFKNTRWLIAFDEDGRQSVKPLKATDRVIDSRTLGQAWYDAIQDVKSLLNDLQDFDRTMELSIHR